MSYGANDKSTAPTQETMDLAGSGVYVYRAKNPFEIVGIQAKKRYSYRTEKGDKADEFAFSLESSDVCQRHVCCWGREMKLDMYRNPSGKQTALDEKTHVKVMSVKKPFHYWCLPCCSRPNAQILDGSGNLVGKIDDDFELCGYRQRVSDKDGKEKFVVSGSALQMGVCCNLCYDAELQVAKDNKPVGMLKRLAMSFTDVFCNSNKFRVDFPEKAEVDDKLLLLGSQLLMDTMHFDNPNEGQHQ